MAKFQPGHQKRGGRKKGTPNKATLQEREFCQRIVTDEAYRTNLHDAMVNRRVAPAIECMVWDRAFGKVKEVVQHQGNTIEPLQIVLTDATAAAPDAESSLS
jgi:hypothetical protein